MFSQWGFQEFILVTSLFVLIFILLRYITQTNDELSYKRLVSLIEISKPSRTEKKAEKSLFNRIYEMIENSIKNFVDKQRRKGNLSSLDLKLKQAGIETTTNDFYTKAFIYGMTGSIIGLITGKPVLIFVFAALGFYLPFYRLKSKIQKRQFLLINQLPEFLDLVAITFPSCSSIEQTFEIVSEQYDNEISKEFQTALQEIKLGRKKRLVYQDLAMRTGLKEMTTLVSQINQAEQFGTGLGEILISQAKAIRQSKKETAEKKGATAQTQIYFPSILLLVVALGIIAFPFIMPILESFR